MDDSDSTGSGLQGESRRESDSYKWIESERAGRDLGEAAVNRWYAQHWNGFLRTRWIEHLEGSRYWIELDRGDFGLLAREFTCDRELLKEILAMAKAGKENLEIVCWANENRIAYEPLVRILEAIDINGRRIRQLFSFDANEPPPLPNPDVIIDGPSPQ